VVGRSGTGRDPDLSAADSVPLEVLGKPTTGSTGRAPPPGPVLRDGSSVDGMTGHHRACAGPGFFAGALRARPPLCYALVLAPTTRLIFLRTLSDRQYLH